MNEYREDVNHQYVGQLINFPFALLCFGSLSQILFNIKFTATPSLPFFYFFILVLITTFILFEFTSKLTCRIFSYIIMIYFRNYYYSVTIFVDSILFTIPLLFIHFIPSFFFLTLTQTQTKPNQTKPSRFPTNNALNGRS